MSTRRKFLRALFTVLVAMSAACAGPSEAAEAVTDTGASESEGASRQERPEDTEVWEPEPAVVTPGHAGAPASDAIVLFDGRDLSSWSHEDGSAGGWRVHDGVMTVVPGAGNIRSRRGFGDIQLHVEWRAPAELSGEGQGRGNSGIFLMERYELQVLDSYDNRTYSNGQAGSIYKQYLPLVNAARGPGVWQNYDVVFTAPRFGPDGALLSPGYMTVFHNGVLIQDHVELRGPTVFVGEPEYEVHPDRVPILLQDHGNHVSYRNIWVREIEGGR